MTTTCAGERIDKTDEAPTLDRRGMLAAMAATAAGMAGAMAFPGVAAAAYNDPMKVGVLAEASDANPTVWAKNTFGKPAVMVEASGHDAVWAKTTSASRSGVYGWTDVAGAYGMFARGDVAGSVALGVSGKVSMSRSGIATFPKKKTYITIPVTGGLSGTTPRIFVTMQGSLGSGVYIAYASKSSSTHIKVRLNKKSTKTSTVAWMVLD